jgi:DNA-binding Lrp family transcriptional regulator
MKDLDELDREILCYLIEDAKTPHKKLAKKLKVHTNTLMQRIRKMEESGVIKKYMAAPDYKKLGYDLHVVVMVRVHKGRIGDRPQLKELWKIPEVQAVYACTGDYDVIVIAYMKDRNDLSRVLRKIEENKWVYRTNTHLVLYAYKTPADYNPLEKGGKKKK